MEELEEMTGRVQDMTPAWQSGAEEFRLAVEERFQTETDFHGQPWADLKPQTIARRLPAKKLQQTSTMKNSNHATGTAEGIEFGTVTPYAARQHFGAANGDDHPARGFLPVDAEDNFIDVPGTPSGELFDAIEEELMDYVEGKSGDGGR
jgi:phage gpG-like protein